MFRNFVTVIEKKGKKIYVPEYKLIRLSNDDKTSFDCEKEKWATTDHVTDKQTVETQPKQTNSDV